MAEQIKMDPVTGEVISFGPVKPEAVQVATNGSTKVWWVVGIVVAFGAFWFFQSRKG